MADAVYKDFFINKTGTLSIALTCKYYNIPSYVICDKRKILKSNYIIGNNKKYSQEISHRNDKNIVAENICFEKIPVRLMKKIFSS